MSFTSHATWPKGTFDGIGNKSTDTHHSAEAAFAVCDLLRQQGAGGEGKAFPLTTCVTDEKGQIVRRPSRINATALLSPGIFGALNRRQLA